MCSIKLKGLVYKAGTANKYLFDKTKFGEVIYFSSFFHNIDESGISNMNLNIQSFVTHHDVVYKINNVTYIPLYGDVAQAVEVFFPTVPLLNLYLKNKVITKLLIIECSSIVCVLFFTIK